MATLYLRYVMISIGLLFSLSTLTYADVICSNSTSSDESGVLYDSGGSASNYSNNENCSFLIQPVDQRDITLSFTAFNYESSFDYIYVYDGTDTSAPLLGSFTGTIIPSDLTATSGAMYIVHSTDFSVRRSGFSASWESGVPLNLVSEWHFDEDEWDGSVNEVIDNRGNINGFAVNGAKSIEDGFICRAASFDGVDDYLTVSGISTHLNGSSSLSFWMKTAQSGDNNYWRAPGITGIEEANKSSNDIFWGYLRSNGRIGLGKGGSNHVTSSVSVNNNTWQHIVLTRDASAGGMLNIYVNGSFNRSTIGRAGGISLDFSSLGRIEDTAGTPGYFAGQLDEVLVFGSVINADQVSTIYSNQSAGNNWDGSTRNCDPTLLAEWRLEDSDWSGEVDEVIDSSGNDYHGRLLYNAAPSNSLPAISGTDGTCAYGSFAAGTIAVDSLPVNTSSVGKTTVSFWMRWDGTNGSMPIGWSYYDLWFYNGSFGFNTWNNDIYGISSSVLNGSWRHITAEFSNGNAALSNNRLWVDGVEQVLSQRRGSPSNSYRSVGSQLRLGGAVNSTSYRFHGSLDEVRVYDNTLSTAQVIGIMNDTHPCEGSAPGYFSISHDNTAVYCLDESLSITARYDDASIVSSYEGTVTLDTQTAKGSWSLVSGNGILLETTSNDGVAIYNFAEDDEGSASFALYYPEGVSLIDIDVYDGSVRDDDSEGMLAFASTGFSITAAPLANPPLTPINDPLTSQVSAQAFSVAIAAYGTDPDSGQCGIIESYAGDKTINLNVEYSNPTTGTLAATGAGELTFIDGQATTTLQYDDAGEVSISLIDAAENISGQTNSIVVRPRDFSIVINDNPATTSIGTGFVAAGESFTVKVQALNTLGNVTPNYGNEIIPENVNIVIDSLVFPIGGHVGELSNAESFTKNASGNNSWIYCAPEGGTCTLPSSATVRYGANNVYTTVSSMTGSFDCSNGVFGDPIYGVVKQCEYILDTESLYFENNSVSWNEVGAIRLQAQVADGNYLGAGNITSAVSETVGRFYPDSFLLGSNSVGNSCSGFTYLSQPELTIAYSLAAISTEGDVLNNYDEGLGYPVGNAVYSVEYNNSGVDLQSRASIASATWQGGEYTLLDTAAVLNRDASREAPLTDVLFGVSMNDIDGRVINTPTINASTAIHCADDNSCNAGELGSASFYYGRLTLDSAYGPETASLPVNFMTEYWNGQKFVTHLFDDCTQVPMGTIRFNGNAINIPANLSVDLVGGITQGQFASMSANNITFLSGDAGFSFSAPGANIALDSVIVDVDLSLMDWLRYDWNQDGDDNNDVQLPTATMRFKTYRGHDRILYWRHR
ncbi:MAG: MSHA biogenesis protein MshQ [Granulosicoccus sp.]|jgi:MSHA biogenesis protein MshQ